MSLRVLETTTHFINTFVIAWEVWVLQAWLHHYYRWEEAQLLKLFLKPKLYCQCCLWKIQLQYVAGTYELWETAASRVNYNGKIDHSPSSIEIAVPSDNKCAERKSRAKVAWEKYYIFNICDKSSLQSYQYIINNYTWYVSCCAGQRQIAKVF